MTCTAADRLLRLIEEILHVYVRLERRPGFAGDAKQSASRVDLLAEAANLNGISGVEDEQFGRAELPSKRHGKDFGREARAAHSEQQNVGEAVFGDLGTECLELRYALELPVYDVEPAQPFTLVGIRPKRGVLVPHPLSALGR